MRYGTGIRIAALAAIAAMAAQAKVNSPLATAADYRFTSPSNTDFIAGKIMGREARPYEPVRGEDEIYLYEAYCEMNGLLEATANSTFAKARGIDRRWLEKAYAAGRNTYTPYGRIYRMLAANTNATAAALLTNGNAADAELATNIWEAAGYDWPHSGAAADAARRGGAAATNTAAMAGMLETWRLVATNVAAYYAGIVEIKGIARDFDAINATNDTEVAEEWRVEWAEMDYYSYQWDTGTSIYDGTHDMQGWGAQSYAMKEQGVSSEPGHDGEYHVSEPIKGWRTYKVTESPTIEARLFPTNFARAAQLTAKKAWVLAVCSWSRSKRRWSSAWDVEDTNTNRVMICAVPASVSFEEKDGVVTAKVNASADTAYGALKGEVDGMPEDVAFPEAPTISGLPPVWFDDEERTWWNSNEADVGISAARIAMIIEVNWNAGFQGL